MPESFCFLEGLPDFLSPKQTSGLTYELRVSCILRGQKSLFLPKTHSLGNRAGFFFFFFKNSWFALGELNAHVSVVSILRDLKSHKESLFAVYKLVGIHRFGSTSRVFSIFLAVNREISQ